MKKVLVVDDEAEVLAVIKEMLVKEGFSVFTAGGGSEGIELAKKERVDVIILDVMMPEVDGGDVAGVLRESPETKDIPVIFLTGLLSKGEEEGNKEAGGRIVLAKPCGRGEIISAIKKVLR